MKFQGSESSNYLGKLILSTVPIGFVGLFFEDQIKSLFSGNVLLVGSMLIITGFLLAMTWYSKSTSKDITYMKAIMIGLSQAIAILPGISRSGSTIATAILLGVDKEKATRFSFLMVLIPIMGATLIKLIQYVKDPSIANGISPFSLLFGFLTAFISGLIACSWMVAIVRKGKLVYFALYCLFIGIVAVNISI